jgi:hypothetical protein
MLTGAGGWASTTGGAALPQKVEFGTNDVDLYLIDFDQTTEEYTQWTVIMPSDWDGSTVTAYFYWTCSAGTTGNVIWGLQGRSYADDEAIDQAWGTAQEVTDGFLAQGDLHVSGVTSAITLAGTPAANELVQFRAYRKAADVGDTFDADARLIGIRVVYGTT